MQSSRSKVPSHPEHLWCDHNWSSYHLLSCEYKIDENNFEGKKFERNILLQTRKAASWLAVKMTKDGHSVAVLSGELTVEQRLAVLDRFRAGLEKVLITTNVLSRGIDVEQVTIVVNFDLPVDQYGNADCETYLHRIGRTGRFGKYFLCMAEFYHQKKD